MAYERGFGPFLLSWAPSAQPVQVVVELALAGTPLWRHAFSPPADSTSLDVQLGEAAASGKLAAQFDATGEHGALEAQTLVFKAPNFAMTFSGTIGTW